MNVIDVKKMNMATKSLESFVQQAKRRLFEFETMKNLFELQQGNFKSYKSASSLLKNLSKAK